MAELTEKEKQISEQLVRFPLEFTSPCYFGDPSTKDIGVNNGTITLIRYRGEKYGITNHHVIEEYRKRLKKEESLRLFIGNERIDLDSVLLDEDENHDLCTLYLEEYSDNSLRSGGEVPTSFFQVDEFTVGELKKGDFILFGGYPGIFRKRPKENELDFGTLSSGGTEVSDVTEYNICCTLSIDKCHVTAPAGDELPENLGGISGGAVFHHKLSKQKVSSFGLVGVIYEYQPSYDSLLIRPISLIDRNVCIKD